VINRFGNNNTPTRENSRLRFGGADVSARFQPAMRDTSATRQEMKSVKPVPFSGLLTNKLLTTLPGEDFARMLPHLEPVSLTGGQDLYGFGEAVQHIYFPESAVVSLLYILTDGSSTESAVIGKEGLIGLSAIFGSPPPPRWTPVLVGGTALRVRAQTLREEFARGGAMQRLILAYAGERIEQLSQRAICNGRHTVEERLCSWLLMISDRVGDDRLPLTHEKSARHLGARRAGITNAAIALRDKQIISYSRGQVRIKDRAGLEQAACECYRMLNRQKSATAQAN
jgi:CRP-like cAMP-binding protein